MDFFVVIFFSLLTSLAYEAPCIAPYARGGEEMVLRSAGELLLQRQARLIALGGALTLREQLLVPPSIRRARSRHHKGKTLNFASAKGTSSRISNIAGLEAFHSDRMLLLTFFSFSFEHCFSQYCLV